MRKFDIWLMHLPTSPYTIATLLWEIQKKLFSIVLVIHTCTSDYLRCLRRKQTVTPPTHHTWEMSTVTKIVAIAVKSQSRGEKD